MPAQKFHPLVHLRVTPAGASGQTDIYYRTDGPLDHGRPHDHGRRGAASA